MRILYLHQHFSTPEGATASRSHAMAMRLAARGHAVTIACGRYQGAVTGLEAVAFRHGRRSGAVGPLRVVEFAIPCGNVQGLGRRSAAFLAYAMAATRLALREHFDLVVASSTPLTVALPALLAKRWRGTPFLFEIRDPWPELPRALGGVPRLLLAGMERLATAACRGAAAVVALSHGMGDTALARGTLHERLWIIPNGCDRALFGPLRQVGGQQEGAREQVECTGSGRAALPPWRPPGVPAGQVLALYAGAHGRANGLEALLQAARLLRHSAPGLTLVLVGDGSEKPRLQREAAALGLGNVLFLNPMPKPRLAALMAGCQIGLHCLAPVQAFAELTAPNKVMDYLAAGLPVLSNQGGSTARLLQGLRPLGASLEGAPEGNRHTLGPAPEGRPCGVAVPQADGVRDAPALAEALQHLVENPALRAALSVSALEMARFWDRDHLADRFCAAAERAGEGARRHAPAGAAAQPTLKGPSESMPAGGAY